ncbi:MAG TPA: flagellar protein FlaG [Selenomonadales bacterium]|nr:flagellar protein FlaG [Selenomonadales bacterium]
MKISAVNPTKPLLDAGQKPPAPGNAAVANDSAASTDTRPKDLEKIVDKMNQDAEAANRQVRFALREDAHRIVVEVVDRSTNEVIATFPPKQILDMMASFAEEAKADQEAKSSKMPEKVQSLCHKV